MVFEKVCQVIASQLNVDSETITMFSEFGKDLKADSVDTVSIIISLENEYGLEFPYEDLDKMVTVADVVRYIEKRIA